MIDKSKLKCNRFPGKIWKSDKPEDYRWYQDQLIPESEPIKWVSCTLFSKYLKSTYDLTLQEYYNIVVFGDINYQPICRVCGENLYFYNLTKGYQEFCSQNCRAKHYMTQSNLDPEFKSKAAKAGGKILERLWKDKDFRKRNSERLRKHMLILNSDPEFRAARINDLLNPIVKITEEYNKIITRGKYSDDYYFYFASNLYGNSNWIKLGVTKYPKTRYYGEIGYHIRVLKTTRLIAARIERDLKFVIADYNYKDSDPENTFEWFTLKHYQEMIDHAELVFANYGFKLSDLKRVSD